MLVRIVIVALFAGCASGKPDFDTLNNLMVTSIRAPVDDAAIEGVWNDASESTIVLVHREGDEMRALIAVGDIRPNIPLTMFEVENMGNHLPGPEERAHAAEALKTWKNGIPTPPDRYLFALAGKNTGPETVEGSWAEGNAACTTSRWGNFLLQLNKDKRGGNVLMVAVYATKKDYGKGTQTFDYNRQIFLTKSQKPIPPDILDNLKKTENFCRKTAGG